MRHAYDGFLASAPKRRTNVSLNARLLDQAKSLNLNISQACEQGIAESVRRALADQWLADNYEAIQALNARVDKEGVPLARFRRF